MLTYLWWGSLVDDLQKTADDAASVRAGLAAANVRIQKANNVAAAGVCLPLCFNSYTCARGKVHDRKAHGKVHHRKADSVSLLVVSLLRHVAQRKTLLTQCGSKGCTMRHMGSRNTSQQIVKKVVLGHSFCGCVIITPEGIMMVCLARAKA